MTVIANGVAGVQDEVHQYLREAVLVALEHERRVHSRRQRCFWNEQRQQVVLQLIQPAARVDGRDFERGGGGESQDLVRDTRAAPDVAPERLDERHRLWVGGRSAQQLEI